MAGLATWRKAAPIHRARANVFKKVQGSRFNGSAVEKTKSSRFTVQRFNGLKKNEEQI
jgi:hypothetical protein